MKKQLCLMLCGVALMGVLTACGEEKISTKDVSLSDISGTLESYSKGSYTSQTIGDLKTEYDIDSGDVKQFSARIKNGTCIVMVEAISDDAANRIEGKLQDYVARYNRTGTDQVVKVGNYVAWFFGEGTQSQTMANTFSELVTA